MTDATAIRKNYGPAIPNPLHTCIDVIENNSLIICSSLGLMPAKQRTVPWVRFEAVAYSTQRIKSSTLLRGLCLLAFGGVPNGVGPNPSLQPSSNHKLLPCTIRSRQFSHYTCNRELTIVLAFRSYDHKLLRSARTRGWRTRAVLMVIVIQRR